ncbi:uncharacterized protein LOC122792773 [Protopterus annectens]|uniref:uncharacterized protein LOC122792773 n=1 Tax=Protopterus annectens TaxID=7888 RepID=UPI001CFB8F59|nr:uncharacterized protein LOC122792773 [Protopterus annectens]
MEVRRAWEPADVVELVKRVKQFGNPYILMRASNLPLQEMWTDVSNSLVEAKVHRVPESCKRKWKLIRQLFFKLLLSTVPVPLRYQDWFGMVMDMWLAAGKPKFGERTYFKRAVIKQSDLAHIKNGPDVFTDAANHNFKSSSGEEASENEESSEESFGGEKDPGAALEADLNHSATVHHWKVKEAIPTATMHKHMEVRRAWEPEEVVELVKRVKLFGNPYILMRASNLPLQEMWIDVSDSLAQARIHRVPESCKGKWKVTRQLFFKLLLSTAPVPPRYQDWFGMVMEMWEAAGRPKFGERTYFKQWEQGREIAMINYQEENIFLKKAASFLQNKLIRAPKIVQPPDGQMKKEKADDALHFTDMPHDRDPGLFSSHPKAKNQVGAVQTTSQAFIHSSLNSEG